LVKSTSGIECFTSMPMSAMKPIDALNDSASPASQSAVRPPMTPSAITEATISVL
jgi:hypothetical protein